MRGIAEGAKGAAMDFEMAPQALDFFYPEKNERGTYYPRPAV